jgi:FAD/FMN-containing dehydrogenase/Fe-S oxidoreductase
MGADNVKTATKDCRCEIRRDDLTRQLYATDASLYQIAPDAVAFPRSAAEAAQAIRAADDAGLAVIPRGAGTGLAGGAVGRGMVIDFSRHNRAIGDFDRERRTIRVGAGVVLDQLNAYLRPHGLWFGPDVATSSRATLGGMIANNSSGAHAPIYGTTAAHVQALELVMADGRIETVGPGYETLADLRASVDAVIQQHAEIIRERFPHVLVKRWPGYGLDRYLREGAYLTHVMAGSEGTLAAIASAELRLVPLPARKGLCLIYFNSITEAAHATIELLDLEPAAIEEVDNVLYDQTRGQIAFAATRALLRLDEEPCKCILIVEFFDEIDDKLAEVSKRNMGIRKQIVTDPREMEMVWSLRKAGLSLLTGCKGSAKPVPGIEDAAVPPRKLAEYVDGLLALFDRMGLQGSFYGHAASGLLHVRPVLDLHDPGDVVRYRQVAEEVSALVLEVKGSISAEHGVGIAHTEDMPKHLGPDVLAAMRAIKTLFDPKNRMNPGKIIPLEGYDYRIDTNLRMGPNHETPMPFEPVLGFVAKDESFIGNLEQCNGSGVCRKALPTMCPTFIATGEEIMSTRGRANAIRAVLEHRIDVDPLASAELDVTLSNCLSCKACTTECPSNVNMTLLKAELMHARQRRDGVSLRDRVISSVDVLGKLGCTMPGLTNALLKNRIVRAVMDRAMGITPERPLPTYTSVRFDRWFAKRPANRKTARGTVILWDDTFVRYNEPNIGRAAVTVLEAAGFEVMLPEGRKCCGRPAFSVGRLDMAKRYGEHNVRLLRNGDAPIVFLEPSCWSMFHEDYAELMIDGAREVAKRCVLFEQFLFDLLEKDPDALTFAPGYSWVAIHGHCHAKALSDTSVAEKLAAHLPNSSVHPLNTGCCGMAGAFGQLSAKYELSKKVAQPLVDQINALQAGTEVVASGTSCRHQIDHLTPVKPIHMAELLANALAAPESSVALPPPSA